MSVKKTKDEESSDASGPGSGDADGGYSIEIAQVKGLIAPLEESVAAAKSIARAHKTLADHLADTGNGRITVAAEDFLSSWGYGMGELGKHADAVVERLYAAVAAYVLADQLDIKDFWPSDANMAKLPGGPSTQWVAENIGVPEMEPRPEFTFGEKLQQKWQDEQEDGS